MKILMLHDIRKEYFELPLNQYRLTFDDGLYSQFYYFPMFKQHPQKLTFFITTSFIKPGRMRPMFSGQHLPFVKSKKYMYRTFVEGRFDHFMNLEELQETCKHPNVQIGAHSHFHDVILTRTHPHKRKPPSPWKTAHLKAMNDISFDQFSIRSKLAFKGYHFEGAKLIPRSETAWEDFIKYDTERCLKWFEQNLKIQPQIYAFPFNEYGDKFISILKSFGFKQFFGARAKNPKLINARLDIDSLINGSTTDPNVS